MIRKKYVEAQTPEILSLSEQIKYFQTFISNRSNHIETRKKVIKRLGNKCIKCGFDNYLALNIDHINGGGNKDRKNNGQFGFYKKLLNLSDEQLHKEYQCLCSNCNQIKKYEDFEWYMTPDRYNEIVENIKNLKIKRKELKLKFWEEKLRPYKNSKMSFRNISDKLNIAPNTVSKYMKLLEW